MTGSWAVALPPATAQELLADLASSFYSCCSRLYSQRRAKGKTEKIVEQFQAKEEDQQA